MSSITPICSCPAGSFPRLHRAMKADHHADMEIRPNYRSVLATRRNRLIVYAISFSRQCAVALLSVPVLAQNAPPGEVDKLYDIAIAPSADRIRDDIQTLVDFGTRHTLSETESDDAGHRRGAALDSIPSSKKSALNAVVASKSSMYPTRSVASGVFRTRRTWFRYSPFSVVRPTRTAT